MLLSRGSCQGHNIHQQACIVPVFNAMNTTLQTEPVCNMDLVPVDDAAWEEISKVGQMKASLTQGY